ncbi:unnamed protein product [Microthlaspi erraticum]|uniref:Uncharacterized protein n=1 Tax=Microthlaspi erraticum TaxID=1685480 RepID=A0A6D2J656_9BRAS|nr:unnamed protein product [Microthlaspi erraticum]
MTLFPTKFENGKIEYKIRYKGRSRPFSRAKALLSLGVKGASSTDSSIELETGQLDRVPQLDRSSSLLFFNSSFKQGTNFKKQQFKMLRGEGSKQRSQEGDNERSKEDTQDTDQGG